MEMVRAFHGYWMISAIGFGISLLALNIITQVVPLSYNLGSTLDTFPPSLYNRWAGAWGFDPFYQTYMFLIPIIATLPFGWSLRDDFETGYALQCESRTGKPRFILNKMMAIFVSGATAATLPLALCFAVSAFFLPAIQPDASAIGAFTITQSSMWANIFYDNALLYTSLYLGLIFITSGIIACFASIIGMLVSSNLICVLSMFFILTIFDAATRETSLASLSTLRFLLPQQISPANPYSVGIFIFTATVLIAACCSYIARKETGQIS